ncbi:hypothetical protein M569_14820 [Genlisea aurea]|uniref:AP2/ERF domain-containing protein n=1 Tax=Genlisea aurea TaxID=192259 RepID=S8C020_9LAMI|nr:hypothetical protein M569_14820 [Genlisea aurea]
MPRSSSDDNSPRNDGATRYRGVRKRNWGKYVTEIRLPNSRERIWLGTYDSPEVAARAFDAASYCLRGPNASFNFPHDPPRFEIPRQLSHEQILTAAQNYANAFSGGGRTTVHEDMENYWSTLQPLETNNNNYSGGGRTAVQTPQDDTEPIWSELEPLDANWERSNISSSFGYYNSGFYGGSHDDGYGGGGGGGGGSASSFPWGY